MILGHRKLRREIKWLASGQRTDVTSHTTRDRMNDLLHGDYPHRLAQVGGVIFMLRSIEITST